MTDGLGWRRLGQKGRREGWGRSSPRRRRRSSPRRRRRRRSPRQIDLVAD